MLHSGGFLPYWNDRLGLKSVLAGESITCHEKFYIIDSRKTDKIFVRFPGNKCCQDFPIGPGASTFKIYFLFRH